ncbi:NAD(P)/FAD-dependent oxidoreductase [Limosilactobacillus caecicola]|uniref:NAD(P)/FAD-dependent oxidoreductase n=1 Tax=Limosilactobacillus caecicola TaxID=2941332 RepID=UPI00203E8776|nr:NAD(P)/FAD-dependent oxidoreductase [Limosilactobacillus caecicola]
MKEPLYDVTIIGGGPAGMFAAFYAGLHELKTQLIEALPQLGGQVRALYPEKQIWDVAGKPGVTGEQLIADLEEQLAIVDIDQSLETTVAEVEQTNDGFLIKTNQGQSQTKAVVIALGNGAFSPRPLAVNGVEQVDPQRIHYFVQHKADFAHQRVAVLGGGNSAMDMAMMLEPVAEQVYLVHRRDQFRGLPMTLSRLKESTVQLRTPYLPREISQAADGTLTLQLKKMRSDDETTLNVDHVLVNYGFTANNAALSDWSLDLATDRHLIRVDSTMATSVPGVYAIGDGNTYPGKAPLIATGLGEGPIAINALAKKLYPDKRMATHSSSLKINR